MVKSENSKKRVLTYNFSDSLNIMTLQDVHASPIFPIMQFFQLSSGYTFFPNSLIIATLRDLHDSPIFFIVFQFSDNNDSSSSTQF